MTLFNILYAILGIIYSVITLKEDEGLLIKFLAVVLLIVSILGLLGTLATELDMR